MNLDTIKQELKDSLCQSVDAAFASIAIACPGCGCEIDPPPVPSDRTFKIVHTNNSVLALKWNADFGADFFVNWGDGNVESFSNNISHDYSGSGEGPFTITLEGDQSEIDKIRKLEFPFQDNSIIEIDLYQLNGLRDLDILELNSLTDLGGFSVNHSQHCSILVAHCNNLSGVLDFSNTFGIKSICNFSQNPLVEDVLLPDKIIDTEISNFKIEGLSGQGLNGKSKDFSNFTNLKGIFHFAEHGLGNTLKLHNLLDNAFTTIDLHKSGLFGDIDLSVFKETRKLYLYNNTGVTKYDLRNIQFVGNSILWVQNNSSLTELIVDEVFVNNLKLSNCGFVDALPLGSKIVFENCEMVNVNLSQEGINTTVETVWANRTSFQFGSTWNLLNTTKASGVFDGSTDWINGLPTSPQAMLWDLKENYGFIILHN